MTARAASTVSQYFQFATFFECLMVVLETQIT